MSATQILKRLLIAARHMDPVYQSLAGPLTAERLDRASASIADALASVVAARAIATTRAAGDAEIIPGWVIEDLDWAEHNILLAQRNIEEVRAKLAPPDEGSPL